MKKILSLTLFLAFLTGCATITDGPKQRVSIVAGNGDNVIATIDGQKVKLPAEVEIKRSGTTISVLAADNPNYMDSSASSSSLSTMGVNGLYWLNLLGIFAGLFPGLTSAIVDTSTGSAYKYTNPQLIVPVYPKK